MDLTWFVLAALAISNLADILATSEPLERPRAWFECSFPRLAKLARCAYCQSFWMSIPAAILLLTCDHWAFKAAILSLAMHRVAQFLNEFYARYSGRAPISAYVMFKDVDKPDSKPPQEPQK